MRTFGELTSSLIRRKSVLHKIAHRRHGPLVSVDIRRRLPLIREHLSLFSKKPAISQDFKISPVAVPLMWYLVLPVVVGRLVVLLGSLTLRSIAQHLVTALGQAPHCFGVVLGLMSALAFSSAVLA